LTFAIHFVLVIFLKFEIFKYLFQLTGAIMSFCSNGIIATQSPHDTTLPTVEQGVQGDWVMVRGKEKAKEIAKRVLPQLSTPQPSQGPSKVLQELPTPQPNCQSSFSFNAFKEFGDNLFSGNISSKAYVAIWGTAFCVIGAGALACRFYRSI
jgi:hypothetical protein